MKAIYQINFYQSDHQIRVKLTDHCKLWYPTDRNLSAEHYKSTFNNLDMIFFTISLVTARSELFFTFHNIILRMGLLTSYKLLPWRRRRTLGNCIQENSRNYAYPKTEFDHSLNTDNNIIILRISILFLRASTVNLLTYQQCRT